MCILGAADITEIYYVIFDMVLIIVGIYIIYAAVKMKKTNKPAELLVEAQEAKKCKDMKGFIEAIYNKTIAFGGVVFLYGVVSVINHQIWGIKIMGIILGGVFLASSGVYLMGLNKAKQMFF